VMHTSDSRIKHAVICMGGDVSSILLILYAIQKGISIFVIAQTGRLSDCIADLRDILERSANDPTILAQFTKKLQRCTCTDSASQSDDRWLRVSAESYTKRARSLITVDCDCCCRSRGSCTTSFSLQYPKPSCISRGVLQCTSSTPAAPQLCTNSQLS
jgi:hypothetical protein